VSSDAAPARQLDDPARARLSLALSYMQAGSVPWAYATAKPLFAAYPDVYDVQDLRCQLATVRWLEPDELKKECAPSQAPVSGTPEHQCGLAKPTLRPQASKSSAPRAGARWAETESQYRR